MLIHELVHKTDLQDVLFHAGQLSSFAKRNLVSVFKRIRSLQTIRTGAVILPTDKDDLTALSLEEFAGASVPDDILEKEEGACILASLIQAWTREYNLRKRAQYYTARKKRHQQDHLARKAEKAAGQTHFRKLAFFDSIMKKAGYDRVSFAKAAHTTVQNLSYHFVRDNANLSTIQSMLSSIGIQLDVGFDGAPTLAEPDFKVIVDGDPLSPRLLGQPSLVALVRDRLVRPARTSFFARLIQQTGLTLNGFCAKTGVKPARLRTILSNDDIRIDEIYQLGEVLGCKVIWIANTI